MWLLVGLLVILAAGAFVYLDPMDLDLLGLKQATVVAVPAAKKHTAAAVVRHPVAAPKAAVALKANAPAPMPPSPAPAEAEPVLAPAQATASAVPPVAPVIPAPPVIKPAPVMAKSKPARPKNLDLRHCLKLETNAAIAKCAGE
ncbi:MAG TPA: hypothetical protein VMV70_05335 [Gallionella sp.]|nr:hypothetical protein [Gallionella sp.]